MESYDLPGWLNEAWHYTTTAALFAIVNSDALHVSALSHMNDTSEVAHGMSHMRSSWEGMANQYDDETKRQMETALTMDDPYWSTRVFGLSATVDHDSMNQWMHYSAGQGVAMLVSADGLMTEASRMTRASGQPEPSELRLASHSFESVLYDRAAIDDYCDQTVSFIAESWKEIAKLNYRGDFSQPAAADAQQFLVGRATQIKHQAFAVEREARMIFSAWGEPGRYRLRNGRLIPYVQVVGLNGKLPIREIRCSPGTSPQDAQTIRSFLRANGYEVPVGVSDIPYRFE